MYDRKALTYLGIAAISYTISAIGFYILYKYRDEDPEKDSNTNWIKRKIKVPFNTVGMIVGREGSNIKSIRIQTGAKIYLPKEEGEHDKTVIISGTEDSVIEAENAIYELVKEMSNIITEEITVPSRICGRLIGKKGENIKSMMRVSKAKIDVSQSHNQTDTREGIKVVLKGTREQIDSAVGLIKKVEEEFANQCVPRNRRSMQPQSYLHRQQ